MVCQEEVFSWFKDLSGYKRLDVMCGLLNMCLPFELRFIGTCVEDLGKKDFHYLREAENRANNTSELSKLTNLNEDVTRSKLIVSLALLESSNHVCSNVIFNILTDNAKSIKLPSSTMQIHQGNNPNPRLIGDDKIVVEELLLLFTMALYHPSFTFEQKIVVGTHLHDMRRWLSLGEERDYVLKDNNVVLAEPRKFKYAPVYTHVCSSTGPVNLNGAPCVRDVELKRYQRRKVEKRTDFIIQVTWLSGEMTEIFKTYQEMLDFRQYITKLSATDSRLKSKESNIPQLPVVKQGLKIEENVEELAARVSEFLQCLTKVVPELMGCEGIVSFFQGSSVQLGSQWMRLPISPSHVPSSQSPMMGTVRVPMQQTTNGPNQRVLKDEASVELGRVKSLTIYNSQIDHAGKTIQDSNRGKMVVAAAGNQRDAKPSRYSSPCYPVSCSTPLTSPHSSPIPSPFASPSQSVVSSRATSPWVQRSDIIISENAALKQLLMQDKLKKYTKLNNYSLDELRNLSDDELIKDGLTTEAIIHLRKKLETLRIHPINGVNIRGGEDVTNCGAANVLVPLPSAVMTGMPASGTNSTDLTPAVVFLSPVESQSHSAVRVTDQPSPIYSNELVLPANSIPNAVMNVGGVTNFAPFATMIVPHQLQPRHVYNTAQPTPQQILSNESSPSCSEYSSPPGSPAMETRTTYDSSCSEEIDREREIGFATKVAKRDISEKISNYGTKDIYSCKTITKTKLPLPMHGQKDTSLVPRPASLPPLSVVMPDIVPISSASVVISVERNCKSTTATNPLSIKTAPALPTTAVDFATSNCTSAAITDAANIAVIGHQDSATSQIVTTSVSSVSRQIPATISGSQIHNVRPQYSDEGQKANVLQCQDIGSCAPCVGHTSELLHPFPGYSAITYPNLSTSPAAAIPVSSSTTTAFFPATNCSSSMCVQTQLNQRCLHASTGIMSSCICSCNQNVHGTSLPYSPTSYLPTFPLNNMYHSYQYVQGPHNSSNFVAPPLPPNFHFATNSHLLATPPIPNGVNPEVVYPGCQFSMLPQNGSQPLRRIQTASFTPTHNRNMFHGTYASQNLLSKTNKKVSCYNCGVVGHRGLECKEATMGEITKPGQFHLNYTPSSRPTEGD